MRHTGILLIAAGGSRRMGQPKQLLDFRGKKLIEHTAEQLQHCHAEIMVGVLGAFSEQIMPFCAKYPFHWIVNEDWESGMAGSIRVGVQELLVQNAGLEQVLIALVDQPFVQHGQYEALILMSELHPDKIVAARYAGTLGAPALIPKAFFSLFDHLEGDQGAGKLIRAMPEMVHPLEMPSAAWDWDSPEDLHAMDRNL